MTTKESLEAKYLAAKELKDNKAYCDYLAKIRQHKRFGHLAHSEIYWKDKLSIAEEGGVFVGKERPLTHEEKNKFRNALYKIHEKIVELDEGDKKRRAKLVSNLKWGMTIAVPVIVAIWFGLAQIKHPDIAITQASMAPIYIKGNNYTMPTLTFTATPTGERSIQTEVNFIIVFINQSENTCGENISFFHYNTREICQYNITSTTGAYHKACGFSSIAPLTLGSPPQYITVTQDIVKYEVNHFLNETKNSSITSCRINESIKVCSSYECNGALNCLKNCSGEIPVSIKYTST